MAQYFTDRLQRVFHLIFMSYDPQSAQEGLRILESIVNNQSNVTKPIQHELRNTATSQGSVGESDAEEVYQKALSPEERELGDAYALLARVYAGPRFTWPSRVFQRIICARISVYMIVSAGIVQLAHYKHCA